MKNLQAKVETLLKHLEGSDYKEKLENEEISGFPLDSIRTKLTNYIADVDRLNKKEKRLTIGIIGQVKAGKSSFLNALFFNCKEVLPKAATPMTAALTKISYGEERKIGIHFYTRAEWELVKAGYEEAITIAQSKLDKLNLERENSKLNKIFINNVDEKVKKFSSSIPKEKVAFYEMYVLYKSNSAELNEFLNNNDGKPLLVSNISDDEELKNRLENYVGVNGKYTPIVKWVQVYFKNEKIKNIDIVDTPGLNDPIKSRGVLTCNFLGQCDAVFLLSRTSEFIDINDIRLFEEQLPQKAIEEIVIVGSRFDSALNQGEAKKYNFDIEVTIENVISTLSERAEKMLKNENNKLFPLIHKILPPQFISSMCFTIAYKEKNSIKLLEEEQLCKSNLLRIFPNMNSTPGSFEKISGLDFFSKKITDIEYKKDEIFSTRLMDISKESYKDFKSGFSALFKNLQLNYDKVKGSELQSIKTEKEQVLKSIEEIKYKIEDIFNQQVMQLKTKIEEMYIQIKTFVSGIHSTTEKRNESYSRRVSTYERGGLFTVVFFGEFVDSLFPKYEEVTKTVTYANVFDAIDKIKNASDEIQKTLMSEFKNIIDLDDFISQFSKIIVDVIDVLEYDKDALIVPLRRTIRSISLPAFRLDKDYSELIYKKFEEGHETSNVAGLKRAMDQCKKNIVEDVANKLDGYIQKTEDILNAKQNTLIPDLSKTVQERAEKLEQELKNKEQTLKLYEFAIQNFSTALKEFES